MKIKTDFVTNSSSSSFVLAVKDDTTKDQLVKLLTDNVKLNACVEECWADGDNFYDTDGMECIEAFRDAIARFMLNPQGSDVKLPGWNVSGFYASNEDDIISNFFYNVGVIKEDNIKGEGYC